MDIASQLKQIGLHNTEITVYLFLLGEGISTPPKIAGGTHIARTNCYHILEGLKEKGLIQEQTKGKRKVYLARDPQAFLSLLERKKEVAERLLPDLRALYTTQKNKPKIRFYEGLEEVKEIYWQTLSAKEIRGIGSTKGLSELDPKFFNSYQRELQKRGVIFHDILTYASKEKAVSETRAILKGLYAAVFLPSQYKDVPTDILLWDDNIALITLQEPVFGTVLTSPLLARTFRVIFDVLCKELQNTTTNLAK